ncbi:hypothetical protein JS541_13880 [Bifidobacterium sp. SO1]|nr:hypothetical protein [Bifidobacterium sp. SO1]
MKLIEERLAPLAEAIVPNLPDCRDKAIRTLEDTYGVSRFKYTKQYADLFNLGLRTKIEASDIGWLNLDPHTNRIHLTDPDTRLSIRVIKKFALNGPLPPAGHNKNRIEAWCQEPLPEFQTKPQGRYPLEGIELIVIWIEYRNRFDCMVCQPTDVGSFPEGAPTAFCLPLVPGQPAFANERFIRKTTAEQLIMPTHNIIVTEPKQHLILE